jgi:hypothetical protein
MDFAVQDAEYLYNGCTVAACAHDYGVFATASLPMDTIVARAPGLATGMIGASVVEILCHIMAQASARDDDGARARALVRRCWSCCHNISSEHGIGESKFSSIFDARSPEDRELLRAAGIASARDLDILAVKLAHNGFTEGIFPHATRFNHSCRPNCSFAISEASAELTVTCLAEVTAGEELTINYLPEDNHVCPTDQRRAILAARYAFHCLCNRCHRPSQAVQVRAAERRLEAMCCPRHSKEGGGACPGLIYPLDEHEQGPEDERREGYTHCDTCGASTAGDHTWRDLDTRVARLHADLVLALRMQPPSTGDEGDWKLLQRLRDLYTRARAVLCADHWLMYRLHERIASTAQEQALALRQGDPSEFRQRVAWFAEHANGQLQCAMALVPLRIHLSAHLHEQAAESLAALLAVLDDRATDLTSAQGSHTAPHSTSNDPRKRARIETSEAQVASLQSLAADAVRKRMRQYQQEAARAHIALAR